MPLHVRPRVYTSIGAHQNPVGVLPDSGQSSQSSMNNNTDLNAEMDETMTPYGHAIDICQLLTERWFGSFNTTETRRPRNGLGRQRAATRCPPRPRKPQPTSNPPVQQTVPQKTPPRPASSQSMPRSAASRPRDTARSEQKTVEEQSAILMDLPGIGTWAGRQRLFFRPTGTEPGTAENPPSPAGSYISEEKLSLANDSLSQTPNPDAHDLNDFMAARRTPTDSTTTPQQEQEGYQEEPNEASHAMRAPGSTTSTEAAWRWRFQRKWQEEQSRTLLPREDSYVSTGDEEEALKYCQAVGMGVDLQILQQRTRGPPQTTVNSMGNNPLMSSTSNASLCFDVDASSYASDLLSMEATSPAASRGNLTPLASGYVPSATKHVLRMANRVKDLMAKQEQVETEARKRWEESVHGDTWAGALVPPVRIDMYGAFSYIVLKVHDPLGHQRFLVRGHNHASQSTLYTEASAEVTAACRAAGIALPQLDLLGVGRMEWRADTERHLHLSHILVHGQEQQGSTDVTRLTASLVQSVLPCHFQISARGGETNGVGSSS